MVIEKKIDYGGIDFGVHAGKNWNELDRDYLQYLISDKCWTSEVNKETAQKVLDQYDLKDGQFPLFKVGGRRYAE